MKRRRKLPSIEWDGIARVTLDGGYVVDAAEYKRRVCEPVMAEHDALPPAYRRLSAEGLDRRNRLRCAAPHPGPDGKPHDRHGWQAAHIQGFDRVSALEPPKALDAIADVVLAYRPKPNSKPAKKRKRRASKIAKAAQK